MSGIRYNWSSFANMKSNLKSGCHNLLFNIEGNKEQCYIIKMRIGSSSQSILIPLIK